MVDVLFLPLLNQFAACRPLLHALHVNEVTSCGFAWDAVRPHVHVVHPDPHLQSVALPGWL